MQRRRPAERRIRACFNFAHVPYAAATVFLCIGIDAFPVTPGVWYANSVILSNNRRKVRYTDHKSALCVVAQKRQYTGIGSLPVKPFEAPIIEVLSKKCRRCDIKPIQVAYQRLDSRMRWMFQQAPVQCRIVIPFASLAELVAHEQ